MNRRIILILFFGAGLGIWLQQHVFSYPPAVGIIGKAKNCLVCHVNNGQWQDEENTIIDILDKKTKKSLIQAADEIRKERKVRTLQSIVQSLKEEPALCDVLFSNLKQISLELAA